MSYLVRHLDTDRTATVDTAGELQDVLTGWFIDQDLAVLQAVDELALALEGVGEWRRHPLQVRLGIEVDEIG